MADRSQQLRKETPVANASKASRIVLCLAISLSTAIAFTLAPWYAPEVGSSVWSRDRGALTENHATSSSFCGMLEKHRYWLESHEVQLKVIGRPGLISIHAPDGVAYPNRISTVKGLLPSQIAELAVRSLDEIGTRAIITDGDCDLKQMYELNSRDASKMFCRMIERSPCIELWTTGFPFKCVQHTRVNVGSAWISIQSTTPSMLHGPSLALSRTT